MTVKEMGLAVVTRRAFPFESLRMGGLVRIGRPER